MTTLTEYFKKIAERENDIFWKNTFLGMADGYLPQRFSIRDGILVYRKKNGTYLNCELLADEEMGPKKIKEFMSECNSATPILSDDIPCVPIQLPWSKIITSNIMLLGYIDRYISFISENMNPPLNNEEKNKLSTMISIAARSRLIDDVMVNNNQIITIPGLSIDPTTRKFYIQTAPSKHRSRSSTTKAKASGGTPERLWKTFKADLAKHISQLTNSIR